MPVTVLLVLKFDVIFSQFQLLQLSLVDMNVVWWC